MNSKERRWLDMVIAQAGLPDEDDPAHICGICGRVSCNSSCEQGYESQPWDRFDYIRVPTDGYTSDAL